MVHPSRRFAAVLALGLALVTLTGAPSYAGAVGLSFDGSHWSSHLSRPLFSPALRWVPGDVGTRSFWIRNQGPTGARLVIGVVSADPDGLLADRDVNLHARVAGGAWVSLRNGSPADRLTKEAIGKGAVRRVDVRAVFDPHSTNPTQRSRIPLRFVVTLTQAIGTPGHHGTGGTGALPNTGSEVSARLVWLAAILIGAGMALVVATRRRRDDEEVAHG